MLMGVKTIFSVLLEILFQTKKVSGMAQRAVIVIPNFSSSFFFVLSDI